MSLTKLLAQDNGYNAEYWRINRIVVYPLTKSVMVDVFGYKSKVDFDAGATAVDQFREDLTKTQFEALAVVGMGAAAKTFVNKLEQAIKEVRTATFSDAVEDLADSI
jgi:hypothetical protein